MEVGQEFCRQEWGKRKAGTLKGEKEYIGTPLPPKGIALCCFHVPQLCIPSGEPPCIGTGPVRDTRVRHPV